MLTTVTGVAAGQMYTYPARCWRKKRRLHNTTDPRLGIYGLQLGKIPPAVSSPQTTCPHRFPLLSASPPAQPSPTHLHHLLQLMWLLVMIWNNLAKSISLCLGALSRTGCHSFFRGWNVSVFIPAGKLVLWEVEHVIRFATAGSSETEFGHCRQYLINVMEWSLAFSGCHFKQLTQHIYLSSIYLIFPLPPPLLICFVSFSLATLSSLHLSSSWAQVTGPFCAQGLHAHWDVTLSLGMNTTKERISHKHHVTSFTL